MSKTKIFKNLINVGGGGGGDDDLVVESVWLLLSFSMFFYVKTTFGAFLNPSITDF